MTPQNPSLVWVSQDIKGHRVPALVPGAGNSPGLFGCSGLALEWSLGLTVTSAPVLAIPAANPSKGTSGISHLGSGGSCLKNSTPLY